VKALEQIAHFLGKPQPMPVAVAAKPRIDLVPEAFVDGCRILGPTPVWGKHGLPMGTEPHRRGNRPYLSRPYNETSVTTQPRFAVALEDMPAGDVTLYLRVGKGKAMSHYRIDLGAKREIDFAGSDFLLAEGPAMLWAFFEGSDGERRRSHLRQFEIAADAVALPSDSSDLYETKRKEFYANLETLSYEENRRLRAQEMSTGASILTSAPSKIQMSLGHVCNLDCIMCSTGRNPDKTALPIAVEKDLDKLLPFVDHIMIQGGEPLMFKNIREVLKKAEAHPQLTVVIGTNGVLLRRGWLEMVVNGRYDLLVSMDATNAETYEFIRRKGEWEDLMYAFKYIRENRRGLYPAISISMCIMRANIGEVAAFVDFAYRQGSRGVYYNLMIPGELEKGYANQDIFDDKDALREVAFQVREAHRRTAALGMSSQDKVLGWIFSKFNDLVLSEEDLRTLNLSDVPRVRAMLADNLAQEEAYWEKKGGRPVFPALPLPEENGFRLPETPHVYPEPSSHPEPMLPQGFYCNYPYVGLNLDVENTYVCCHAHRPFSHISYGPMQGVFDVWNHPVMQKSRLSMNDGTAADKTCHESCPHYRNGGYRKL
jgi:sulfatase maturation enzyme AslB (radical SAM superfamily)